MYTFFWVKGQLIICRNMNLKFIAKYFQFKDNQGNKWLTIFREQ